MGTSIRRIQQIATDDLSKLNPGQIGYTTSADDVLGKRVFGGKNDMSEISIFLEKDRNVRVLTADMTAITKHLTPQQIPINIKTNLDSSNGFDPSMNSIVLSATHTVSYDQDFTAPHILYAEKSFVIDFPEISQATQGTGAVRLTQKNAADNDTTNQNRKSTLSMVQNKVIVNAYDVDDIQAVITTSTFACLTLIYDSRNQTDADNPSAPISWWNVGTVSNGDLIMQSSSYANGEDGPFRLTSAGGLTISNPVSHTPTFKVYGNSATYDAEAVFSIPVMATSATNSTRLDKLSCSMYVTSANPSTLYIRVKGDDGQLRVGSIALSV